MSERYDKRRRQWQPISVLLPHGKTGQALKKRFGRDGILVWTCFLLACKRNWIQGEFEYVSEDDGWSRLGLGYPDTPGFTLGEFFQTTGRLKLTSKRRSGEVTHVSCTTWSDWEADAKREADAERKSSKRAQNTRTKRGQSVDITGTLHRTDSDLDLDKDQDLLGLRRIETNGKGFLAFRYPTEDVA